MIHIRVRVCAASGWVRLGCAGDGVGVVVGLATSVAVEPHRPIPLLGLGGERTLVDGKLHKESYPVTCRL